MPVDKVLQIAGLTDKMLMALLSWVIVSAVCCLLAVVLKRIPVISKVFE